MERIDYILDFCKELSKQMIVCGANIERVDICIEHLCHAAKIMGVEHVGLGTDFDGDGGVPGLADASEIINFTRHLLHRHFSEQDIRLIMGGNFLRVMAAANNCRHNDITS